MKNLNAVAFATCAIACACLNEAYANDRTSEPTYYNKIRAHDWGMKALVSETPAPVIESTAFEDTLSEEEFEERFSGPAVSELNFKFSFGYVSHSFDPINVPFFTNPVPNDTQEGIFVDGSVAVPIGERFGFQADGFYGDLDGDINLDFYGAGAHFFWRDPSIALLGLYAHYKEYGDAIRNVQFAFEGEVYHDKWSFEFLAGADIVDTEFGSDAFFSGEAVAAYYPTDNFRISAGVRHSIESTVAVVGTEFMFPAGKVAPAVFADVTFGENDTLTAFAGARLYLGGKNKSLIRRHREDDPKIRLETNSPALGACYNNAQSNLYRELTEITLDPARTNGEFDPSVANFQDCKFTFAEPEEELPIEVPSLGFTAN